MCGITGFYHLQGKGIKSLNLIRDMTNSMIHRGPDDSGIYADDIASLGQRRLSIIDLSENGRQPMSDEKENAYVIFNGEIYNFVEIKKELLNRGYKFRSTSDTEVIVQAYIEWGIKCIERFNGMFSIAIYDKQKGELFLIRDRLGIKPLFYTIHNDAIVFGSEIKSILLYPGFRKEPNFSAISSYLSYRYVLGEETLFKGIKKVLPGYYLHAKKGSIKKYQYYELPIIANKRDIGMEYYKKKLKKLLDNSISMRMMSDVPLGAYLSGGLDSSIIVAVMAKLKKSQIKTFTIGFKEADYNEFEYGDMVAKMYDTDHTKILVSADKYLKTMEELIKYKDLPLGVPNEVPLYLMSKELKKYITVVISGEGADEIFSGYGRIFQSPYDYYRLKFFGWMPGFSRLFNNLDKKYGNLTFKTQLQHFLFNYSYFPLNEKLEIFNDFMKDEIKNDDKLTKIFESYFKKTRKLSYHDKIGYVFEKLHLPGLLARADNSTMATSVEARVPFVDHKIVEFMLSVPMKYKLKWRSLGDWLKGFFQPSDKISENMDITKYILREVYKQDLPKDVVERKKQGFPVPLDLWFKGDFIEHAKKELLSEDSRIKTFINIDKLQKWIEKNIHDNTDKQFGQKLWMILNLEIWFRTYWGDEKLR